jgi:hypothetical protein
MSHNFSPVTSRVAGHDVLQNVASILSLYFSFFFIVIMDYRHKVAFTSEDDALLMKYIATYNPRPKGRLGMKLYERLVENVCAALIVMLYD